MERGFWAVLVGGAIGGFVGLWPGGFLAFWLVDTFQLGTGGLEDLAYALIGAVIGAWLGCSLGAWFLMRLTHVDRRGPTVAWLTVLSPILVGGTTSFSIANNDSEILWRTSFPFDWVLYGVAVLSGPLTAYLSRRFAGARRAGDSSI